MYVNAATERFMSVEIFGIPALFTVYPVNRDTVPKGMYAYDLRAKQDNWLEPDRLAQKITTEHYGTVLTASPIDLPESGYREMCPGDLDESNGAEHLTVAEFEAKYLSPAPPPPSRAQARRPIRPRSLPTR